MSGGWAVRMSRAKMLSAAMLRLRPGILVAQIDDVFWLRGTELGDDLSLELRKLPGAERFSISAEGTLTPEGARLPIGKLPDVDWQPLPAWLKPVPQPAALAGHIRRRMNLRLVRTGNETPASVLLLDQADWLAYAVAAPLVRLQAIQFAMDQSGRTILRGRPLSPLPGRRYVEHEGIAIPCGHALAPAIDSATIRVLLNTSAADLALFDADGSVEVIGSERFVRASRAAARATVAAANGPGSIAASRADE